MHSGCCDLVLKEFPSAISGMYGVVDFFILFYHMMRAALLKLRVLTKKLKILMMKLLLICIFGKGCPLYDLKKNIHPQVSHLPDFHEVDTPLSL